MMLVLSVLQYARELTGSWSKLWQDHRETPGWKISPLFTLEDLRGITESFPTAFCWETARGTVKSLVLFLCCWWSIIIILLLILILILIDLQRARAKSEHGAA